MTRPIITQTDPAQIVNNVKRDAAKKAATPFKRGLGCPRCEGRVTLVRHIPRKKK